MEYKDCCAIITRHPRTRLKGALVTEYAERFRFSDLVWGTIEGASLVAYNPKGDALKVSRLTEAVPGPVTPAPDLGTRSR